MAAVRLGLEMRAWHGSAAAAAAAFAFLDSFSLPRQQTTRPVPFRGGTVMNRFREVLGVMMCVALLLATGFSSLSAGADAPAPGRVIKVTLYRGQAMVVRELPVDGAAGTREIVVGELPENVVADSLFAEGSAGVEVRAVRYRTHAVGEAPREEVRQLDEQIEAVNRKITVNGKTRELLTKRLAYLDQLEGFVAPTAKTELSQGVLDAETLKQITLFSFEQRQEILDQQVENEKEATGLADELSLLQRKRSELASGASKTAREAVVFAEKKGDAGEVIRLAYLVSSCGWSPSYTIRAGEDRQEVRIECNALIHQMTGEDWSGVDLTLSTASPALSAAGPGLAPFPVALRAAAQQKGGHADLAKQVQSIRTRQLSAIVEFQNTLDLNDNIGSNWRANAAANDLQSLEMLNPSSALRTIRMQTVGTGDGPSLAYHLATPVSLASRSDQQMVRIVQTSLPSTFHHKATPVLTSYVYREAEVTNNSDEDLLRGPITVYLNGSFVGRSEMPTVARGQKFVVGFGADPQLRAKRELADKNDEVQGGNRRLSFDYRLVVENYKTEPVAVSVYDRLPHAERTADVAIELGDLVDALSADKLYQRVERPKGILRWDIEVPAGATGENARLIKYNYTAEFDRQFQLGAAATDTPSQQREFEELQRVRNRL
jgi:uncharacterized protein (TIGR02231 family)